LTNYSYSYLGPGIAGGTIVAVVGFIVAIIAAIFGILWFPIKRMLKNRKKKTTDEYSNK
jgi:TM2 domain-containing membrane protein YozV|tara:strand:- start:246 stop:422 length:177 start_codon:yes stop_codon:yes gene_type:complete